MAQTILVVDDDQDLVYIITEFLKKHGYEILPNMGGWHFTQKVREDKRCAHIPIIVLSGLLESDSEPETFEAANAYMGKPFEVFKLLEKVQSLLIKPQ